jgi:hypothetical protein
MTPNAFNSALLDLQTSVPPLARRSPQQLARACACTRTRTRARAIPCHIVGAMDPNPRLLEDLPVSGNWLKRLRVLGAHDPFRGTLARFSATIRSPFWCRQLLNAFTDADMALVSQILPMVRSAKLGVATQSTAIKRHMYYTYAWNSFPCTCAYRYEGVASSKHIIGTIGSRNPTVCGNHVEAWLALYVSGWVVKS